MSSRTHIYRAKRPYALYSLNTFGLKSFPEKKDDFPDGRYRIHSAFGKKPTWVKIEINTDGWGAWKAFETYSTEELGQEIV
tara:strand:+ start:857 stop:1099 length:243 start_codon:yes stop_codon:yes gene_type:complete